ncbi:hypothetical protein AWZ03_013398 [Drosophila navojoa]|uniref:Uncharacterized protein n=1 Tax=Drosophila navojoa TaxID=7232 RepID=A0A484AUU7_DRONA|nr:hypothetical protein AWZ03_013398 [Drosophila navojoa]
MSSPRELIANVTAAAAAAAATTTATATGPRPRPRPKPIAIAIARAHFPISMSKSPVKIKFHVHRDAQPSRRTRKCIAPLDRPPDSSVAQLWLPRRALPATHSESDLDAAVLLESFTTRNSCIYYLAYILAKPTTAAATTTTTTTATTTTALHTFKKVPLDSRFGPFGG